MRSKKTLAELTAWLEEWWDEPDAQTLADFLGIELALEIEFVIPVGQRRRSPEGVEVIKTNDDGTTTCWWKYNRDAGLGKAWFSDDAVAGWEVITDEPECDGEHLPDWCVPINLSGWSDDDLRVAVRVVGSGGLGASFRAELARRGES